MNEEECLKSGGHCWNEHSANTVVDDFGNDRGGQNLVYYPDGEPRFRTCKHCGKKQRLINEWRDIE